MQRHHECYKSTRQWAWTRFTYHIQMAGVTWPWTLSTGLQGFRWLSHWQDIHQELLDKPTYNGSNFLVHRRSYILIWVRSFRVHLKLALSWILPISSLVHWRCRRNEASPSERAKRSRRCSVARVFITNAEIMMNGYNWWTWLTWRAIGCWTNPVTARSREYWVTVLGFLVECYLVVAKIYTESRRRWCPDTASTADEARRCKGFSRSGL